MPNQRFTQPVSHLGEKAKEVAKDTGATGVLEAAKEKAQGIAEGATEFASKAKDTAQEWASSSADVASRAGETVKEAAGTAYEKAEDLGANVTSLIRRYPIESLLVGLGLGFLLAQACRRS